VGRGMGMVSIGTARVVFASLRDHGQADEQRNSARVLLDLYPEERFIEAELPQATRRAVLLVASR
jgi:hypothetical protein